MGISLGVSFSGEISAPEMVRLAAVADDAGLSHVWLTEDMYFRAPMPVAGAIATATKRITIGFGVLTVYNRHPSLIAMEMVSLAELAGPRLIVGIGGGVARRLGSIGVTRHTPVAAAHDAITIVRALLGGGVASHDGSVHRADGLALDVQPVQPAPPIYAAAMGPNALRQAGRIADGLILGIMSSPAWVEEARRIALDGRDPRSPMPTVVFAPTEISDEDPAGARQAAARLIAYYAQRWLDVPILEGLLTTWVGVSHDELVDLAARLQAGEPEHTVIPDRMVESLCLAGSIDDVRGQVRAFEAAGVTHLAATIDGETKDPQAVIRALASIAP